MSHKQIRWLLGELPTLLNEGVIVDLYVDGTPIRNSLDQNPAPRPR